MTEATSLCPGEPLFLAERHREELIRILQRYVPGEDVWAFGSRATGRHVGRFSDLDLAIGQALETRVRYDLKDALDESMLPIRVDFVELNRVDASFAERIQRDFVLVRSGDAPAPASKAGQSPVVEEHDVNGEGFGYVE